MGEEGIGEEGSVKGKRKQMRMIKKYYGVKFEVCSYIPVLSWVSESFLL